MLKTIQMLKNEYKDYSDVYNKIKRLVNEGKLFQVTRGLYETNEKVSGFLLAQYIYGPSYLSFEFALSYYNLIPERVYDYTCATFKKKKSKVYNNYFGTYTYKDTYYIAYPYGINSVMYDNYCYLIASKEKAICDMLYIKPQVNSITSLKKLLFEDLRIDINEFSKLNQDELIKISKLYINKSNQILNKWLGGKNNEWNHSTND